MLNQLVIVGRLVENPTIEKLEDKKIGRITLAVQRSYKNINGEFDTDFIECILWNGIAENTCEYCHKGDLVGVKGRMQSRKVDDKNILEVVAEKVTFLSSKKINGNEEE